MVSASRRWYLGLVNARKLVVLEILEYSTGSPLRLLQLETRVWTSWWPRYTPTFLVLGALGGVVVKERHAISSM
jgi:hypothetical protein